MKKPFSCNCCLAVNYKRKVTKFNLKRFHCIVICYPGLGGVEKYIVFQFANVNQNIDSNGKLLLRKHQARLPQRFVALLQ